MNSTNRAINRIILFIVGLVLLGTGGAVVTITAWPAAAQSWTAAMEAGRTWLEDAIAATTFGERGMSWIVIAVLALILVLVILLIVVLIRLGGGRSRIALASPSQLSPLGRVTVRSEFVSDALKHAFDQRDEILSSSVRAATVRHQPVMHLSVTPRRNASPRMIVEDLDQLVKNVTILTGSDMATYISLHSGLRARLAHDHRRLE